jgi:VIT1/CCC1 family predicted Fe2+/Mn2+ transporter
MAKKRAPNAIPVSTTNDRLLGAAIPLIVVALVPAASLLIAVPASSLLVLACLGALAARTGGARMAPGAIRVTFWGALAMGVTAGAGALFGTMV